MIKYTVGLKCRAGEVGLKPKDHTVMALHTIYNKNVLLIVQVPGSLTSLASVNRCYRSKVWLFLGSVVDAEKISMPNR